MEVAQPRSHPPAHCAAIGEDSAAGMADVTTGVASAPHEDPPTESGPWQGAPT